MSIYDPSGFNDRVIDIVRTDTILRLTEKKDSIVVEPLSKTKLMENNSATNALTSFVLAITTLLTFQVSFPEFFDNGFTTIPLAVFSALASAKFVKTINSATKTDVDLNIDTSEKNELFNGGKNLPVIAIGKEFINKSNEQIIDHYRKTIEPSFIVESATSIEEIHQDRTFSKLFNNELDNDDEILNEVSVDEYFEKNDKNVDEDNVLDYALSGSDHDEKYA